MLSYTVLPPEFYANILSDVAKSRRSSPIRDLFPLELIPGNLGMLAGKPSSDIIPVTGMSLTIKTGPNGDETTTIELDPTEVVTAFQYGPPIGHEPLIEWAKKLVLHLHGRDVGTDDERPEGLGLCIGSGSQDLMYKAVTAIVNPGDSVFMEAPTYPGVIPLYASLSCDVIEIDSDEDGMVPSKMRSVLENWPAGKPYPKMLYTIPFGCNPSGATITLERRREVLALARKYNIFIVEDDPYYHLRYIDTPHPPTYLALEKIEGGELGRVVRLDSFSKVLSGGLRLGWMTAPLPILKAVINHLAITTLQPPSTSQIIAYKILTHWGLDGFLSSTCRTSAFYKAKRDIFDLALKKHLSEFAEWFSPNSGLFFWVKLKLPPTPNCPQGDANDFVRNKAIPNQVILLPGQTFFYDQRQSPYIRLSFTTLDEELVHVALGRIAELLKKEWDDYAAKYLPN